MCIGSFHIFFFFFKYFDFSTGGLCVYIRYIILKLEFSCWSFSVVSLEYDPHVKLSSFYVSSLPALGFCVL